MKTGMKVGLIVGGVAVGGLVAVGLYEESKKSSSNPPKATTFTTGHYYTATLNCPGIPLPAPTAAFLGVGPITLISVSPTAHAVAAGTPPLPSATSNVWT